MKIAFVSAAQAELADALAYYDAQQPGLGASFLTELEACIERVRRLPGAWQPLGPNLHRCRMHRFPYAVIYAARADAIVILAVANLHRNPDYWRNRLGPAF